MKRSGTFAEQRVATYRRQRNGGALTPRQRRRVLHKARRDGLALAVVVALLASCGSGARPRESMARVPLAPTTTSSTVSQPPPLTSSTDHAASPAASRSQTVPWVARPQPATPAPSTSGDIYDQLAACESDHGDVHAINPRAYNPAGPGYWGAFQFALSTWHSIGMAGNPADYPYEEQKAAVVRSIPRSSWHRQFPACSRRIGA